MKYTREIKVGILAIVCVFLLIFGFNYLKGVNIFSSVLSYHGRFAVMSGLEEQAPVYIRGYKVGQVNKIRYDFTKDSAFIVDINIKSDIALPHGTQMALVSDGLLGGMAIELRIPQYEEKAALYKRGNYLPTLVVPTLVQNLQAGLLQNLNDAVIEAKALVATANRQLEGDYLHSALHNIDSVSHELTGTSHALKVLMADRMPNIVNNVDSTMDNLNTITHDIRQANIKGTVARVDTAVDHVNYILADVRQQKGTLGKLIYDKSLYTNVNTTVVAADSLLVDLKAHPKRYVHFSIFGKKDK